MIVVFVGPSAYGARSDAHKLIKGRGELRGPIKRGDLPRLPSEYTTVLIVDGYWKTVPAVGHAEIRTALKTRRVYGCSSIGAIRAFEMRDLGMIGRGVVYEMFCSEEDFRDDEVALHHCPDCLEFEPLSESLVNIRVFLSGLVKQGDIGADASRSIIHHMEGLHFANRTTDLLCDLLSREVGAEPANELVSRLPGCRIKTRDFVDTLEYLCAEENRTA